MPKNPPSRRTPNPTLTARQRHALQKRLVRWTARDTWTLAEASLIAYGVAPGVIPVWLDFRTINAEDLLDYAQRAVRAGHLRVGNPDEPIKSWWVRPGEFGQWVATRADLIGEERALIFQEWFPASVPSSEAGAVRRAVLEADYSTVLFDLTLAAINHFWIPWQRGERDRKPKKEEIEQWLRERAPEVSDRMMRAIPTIIAPDTSIAAG